MIEPITRQFVASDGYPLHITTWRPVERPRVRVVVLHGVQSHAGWYHHLGRTLASAGVEAHFPDRRGSGSNHRERGHCPSSRRLVADVIEVVDDVRASGIDVPLVLAGISWGGKLVVVSAAKAPDRIDAIALICPGLQPRVGVSRAERLRIAFGFFFDRRRAIYPIPLADPALFTGNPDRQRFIAEDELGLRKASAALLAASTFLDRAARRARARVVQPCLLMLAGRDRIVDNERTRAFVSRMASVKTTVIEYPEAHHTLEFEPDPGQHARDLIAWIDTLHPSNPSAVRPVLAEPSGPRS